MRDPVPHCVARELADAKLPNDEPGARALGLPALAVGLRAPGDPPKPLEVFYAHRVAVAPHDKAIVGEPAGHVDEDARGEGVEAVSDESSTALLGEA